MFAHPRYARLFTLTLLALLIALFALTLPPLTNADPTATYPFNGTYTPPAQTPVFDVPPPVPPWPDVDDAAIVNVLLLGSDSYDAYIRRTDVMILVSINTQSGTVAMWHIPRALFVYIPNHTLDLINTVYVRGESDHPGGGFELLRETFRYNFGIELDHYARVNFEGFMALIERMGGLTISVDCSIEDWRLKDPTLDPANPDSWEKYELPVGVHTLSPYMALWYARSRKTTSDLDRGRRQMDVLRAIWRQLRDRGLLEQVQELWPFVRAYVDTDMTLEDVLALVPLGLSLDPANIARYSGQIGTHYVVTYTPDNGREVLLPAREYLLPMVHDLLTPPTANRLGRAALSVDVYDSAWWGNGVEFVVADRLAWEGFAARPLGLGPTQRESTVIVDYTGQAKGSALGELMRVLRVDAAHVTPQPDPNRTTDYRVEIGTAYNACKYGYAEAELGDAPVSEYLPAEAQGTGCWLRFRAQVNVRAAPGTQYEILRQATPADVFAITGRNADGTWWRVRLEGQSGWVSAEINTASAHGACDAVPAVDAGAP